ncbi:hypothetical protein M8818_004249 [Zalaria obscura]|uniref:Uncharacterized protein n=1 Tax=Zalaria obscura TaxID=2024903 RepID=A0ACC3SGJ3_9PEZI
MSRMCLLYLAFAALAVPGFHAKQTGSLHRKDIYWSARAYNVRGGLLMALKGPVYVALGGVTVVWYRGTEVPRHCSRGSRGDAREDEL